MNKVRFCMVLLQIIVDTKYLEDATICLYEFISNITGSELVTTQVSMYLVIDNNVDL